MIQPIGDRLLVKQLKKENKSGIILSDNEEEVLLPKGEVIDIGFDECLIDLMVDKKIRDKVSERRIKNGDIVYFNELAGERIKDGEEEYLVLKYQDIIAKVC